jgi:catechol 2,3-dioxygenase-like lactoylglutathione lyase family enzyme
MRLHHVALVVTDLARAEHFYVGVLNLEIERRWTDDAGAPRSTWLKLEGGALLMLEKLDVPARTHCLALTIDRASRESWEKKLKEAGFPVQTSTAFTLYVLDPDGNRIALSHHPDPA